MAETGFSAVVVTLLLVGAYQFNNKVYCYELRQRACQRGGGAYCSTGKQRFAYVGLLDTASQLRTALEATAFINEVIIFAESRVSEALQTVARISGDAGYGHVLPLLDSVSDCEQLAHVLAPWEDIWGPTGCGAYSSQDESGNKYPFQLRYFQRAMTGSPAWWRKWFTAARAVVLGYNVLAIDSDVLVLDDWYWRVKQPPLSDYHMLSQSESSTAINGGFTYIQNAASNGPVSWILYEAMFRLVRWSEDPSILMKASASIVKHGTVPVDDQTLLTDALLSCLAGRPVYASLAFIYDAEEAAFRSLGLEGRLHLLRNIGGAANGWMEVVQQLTGPLAAQACEMQLNGTCQTPGGPTHGSGGGSGATGGATATSAIVTLRSSTLRMPHSGGEWPLELGGYPFGLPLGPHALSYKEAFTELGVPLPPDPEDPAALEISRAIKPELFGLLNLEHQGRYLGSWAESSWWSAGRHGYWHKHLWPPPPSPPLPQAMGHVFAGLWPGSFQKDVVLQLTGHYDWRVAARLAGSPLRVFHTHTKSQDSRSARPYDIRLVLAYSPDAVPWDVEKPQFVRAVQGLARLALALGAVAAWPAAPCTAPWALADGSAAAAAAAAAAGGAPAGSGAQPPPLQQQQQQQPQQRRQHSIPWTYLQTAFTVQPFGDALDELQCEWVGFSDEGCLVAAKDEKISGGEGADDNGGNGVSGSDGGGRALLAVEFQHLRHLLAPKSTAEVVGGGAARRLKNKRRRRLQPSAATTLRLFPEDTTAAVPATNDLLHKPKYGDIVQLNAELVRNSLRRDTAAVLWLDRLVYDVEGLPEALAASYKRWSARCRALHYYDLPEGERSMW